MAEGGRDVIERKLAFLGQFLADLELYARLDADARRKEHYAIERLLQLLCESAADIGLQMLRRRGGELAGIGLRIGHMGVGTQPNHIIPLLLGLEETLRSLGRPVERGSSLAGLPALWAD